MKKLLFLLLTFTFALSSAQFTVATTKEEKSQWTRVTKYADSNICLFRNGDALKIIIQNPNQETESRTIFDDIYKELHKLNTVPEKKSYEMIVSVPNSTFDDLFGVIEQHFKEKKVENITLNFPEGPIYLVFKKVMGQYNMYMGFETQGKLILSTNYSISGLSKVFSKK